MADKKISALTASTTPLAGTEVLPIVQAGSTVKVAVSDLTAGRAISSTQATLTTGNLIIGTTAKGVTTGSAIPLGLGVNNTVTAITVDTSSKVGVGTAAPAATFDVSGNISQNIVAVAALNIDCSLGNYFTKTINGNSTFTFSNVPTSRAFAFTLELTHTSGAVTWPASVNFPGGTAPTLSAGSVSLFTFVTDDGGTRFRAASQVNYAV